MYRCRNALFAIGLFVVSVGTANAQSVYVFPDGRVQWTPNVNARPVPVDNLPADLQEALLKQKAAYPTTRDRLAQASANRPAPSRSGVLPSRLRQQAYQAPSQSGSSPIRVGIGIGFGFGPFTISLGF